MWSNHCSAFSEHKTVTAQDTIPIREGITYLQNRKRHNEVVGALAATQKRKVKEAACNEHVTPAASKITAEHCVPH